MTFFKYGAFPVSFGILLFFLVHITIYSYSLAMVIGSMKEEGRVCISSIHRSLEKGQPQQYQFWTGKNQVDPGIRTRLARTDCHCSTACATSATLDLSQLQPCWKVLVSDFMFSFSKYCVEIDKSKMSQVNLSNWNQNNMTSLSLSWKNLIQLRMKFVTKCTIARH